MSKTYNIPENIYILYLIGTNHSYSDNGVNRIFLLEPNDVPYDAKKVVAKDFELNYISDHTVSNELAETKRLYLIYDTAKDAPYIDTRLGKKLVAFTTHKKAATYNKRNRSGTCILTCGYRERDRKRTIDLILQDLEEQEKGTH